MMRLYFMPQGHFMGLRSHGVSISPSDAKYSLFSGSIAEIIR